MTAYMRTLEEDCDDKTCKVDVEKKDQENFIQAHNLIRFDEAIRADLDLKILGTNAELIVDGESPAGRGKDYPPDTLFMIRDNQVHEAKYGAYIKVPVIEVMNMPAKGSMHDLLLKIKGEKDPRSLVNITRIVGYYSRIHNWNRSKIGELRDRNNGIYALSGVQNPDHGAERQKTINKM